MGEDNIEGIDLQKSTKTYKNSDSYDLLDEKHRTAVDLRIEFYKYKYIAAKLQLKEQTVREWFEKGGICYAAYQWKLKQRAKENKELKRQLKDQLYELGPEAIVVVREALLSKDVDAAYKLLDRIGFKPVEQFEDVTKESRAFSLIKEFLHENERIIKDKKHPAGVSDK